MSDDGNSHFLMALGRIDGGLAIETADELMRQVIAAVHRTGKKGKVTVCIEIGKNGELGLETTAKVTASAPLVQFGKSFFFTDPRTGDLTRQAPDLAAQGHFQEFSK